MANNALKKITIGLFSLLLVFGLFGAASALELDANEPALFVIDDVNYDDPYAPGETIPVEIELENLADKDTGDDIEDITVEVWIEDDMGEEITDKVEYKIKQITQDDYAEFTVDVPVPIDAVTDEDYTLHVTAEGEWEETGNDVSDSWTDKLEIEQPEHGLYVEDVRLSREKAFSGETVDVAVEVANIGEEDESNVKVKVEIPEIGATKTISLLNTIGSGYDYTTYLTLDIPEADSGVYTLEVKVYNEDAGDVYEQDIVVEEAEVIEEETVTETPTTTSSITQTISVGQGSVFSIQVSNNLNIAKTYEFDVGGVADWATARVDPARMIIGPGDSAKIYVYVNPTEAGEHTFTLFVKENGAVIAANQMNVNVADGFVDTGESSDMQTVFGFLILVFTILIAGYIYKHRESEKGKQVYY
ncbi:putative S-layer protein [Candidatus Woesearchaeota archaeon]|nr:putative S-layer protein [Candidatus Woesearchaeota archaeon]